MSCRAAEGHFVSFSAPPPHLPVSNQDKSSTSEEVLSFKWNVLDIKDTSAASVGGSFMPMSAFIFIKTSGLLRAINMYAKCFRLISTAQRLLSFLRQAPMSKRRNPALSAGFLFYTRMSDCLIRYSLKGIR